MAPKRTFNPTKEALEALYPEKTLREIAAHYGVGETVVHKRFKEHGIPRTRKPRKPRSQTHSDNISRALRGQIRPDKRRGLTIICEICGTQFYVVPARSSARFCSNRCRGVAKRVELGSKVCPQCDKTFSRAKGQGAGNFRKQVYCSVRCSNSASPPPTFYGSENPNWKGETARRKQLRTGVKAWRTAVLERDKYTCQCCGAASAGTLLTVHHIRAYEDCPELRTVVENGLTLCEPCHFREHGWNLEIPGVVEVEDERGVLLRRVFTHCANCGKPTVKQASEMRRSDGSIKEYVFCNKLCSISFLKRTATPFIRDLNRAVCYETPKEAALAYRLASTGPVYQKLRGNTQAGKTGNLQEIAADEYYEWAAENGREIPFAMRPRISK